MGKFDLSRKYYKKALDAYPSYHPSSAMAKADITHLTKKWKGLI